MSGPGGAAPPRDRLRSWVLWMAALGAPVAVAAALIPGRGHLSTGRRRAHPRRGHRGRGVVGAARAPPPWLRSCRAASFDFLLTRPYESFRISRQADLTTELLFVVVGLLVGELAARGRRHRRAAAEGRLDLSRIHDMAERIAGGEEPDFVLMAVASELRDLLGLQDCRFVWDPPSGKGAWIDPDGTVRLNPLEWPTTSAGLPTKQVELPVRGAGRTLGTFILTPTPALPISQERCVVAVALADQLGSALSARTDRA